MKIMQRAFIATSPRGGGQMLPAIRRASTSAEERVIAKMSFGLLFALLSLQFSDLDIAHIRIGIWGLTFLLLMMVFGRLLSKKTCRFPSWKLLLPLFFAVSWKLYELTRSPGEFREASIVFGDFLCVILTCILVAPTYFKMEEWLQFVRTTYLVIFILFVLLHPFVPNSTALAGWDKGQKWMFSHPNGAAMFALTIFISAILRMRYPLVLGARAFNYLVLVAFLFAIIPTNSRTSEASVVAIFAVAIFGIFFGGLWRGRGFESQALKNCLVFIVICIVGMLAFFVFSSISENKLDELSSGRFFVNLLLIQNIPNIWLGVGLMPPGDSLEFSVASRGAGIDGLYANLIYSEGYVGLILFFVVMAVMAVAMVNCRKKEFPYFIILPMTVLLNGLTETHFWLLPSPLTVLTLGCAAIASQKEQPLGGSASGR